MAEGETSIDQRYGKAQVVQREAEVAERERPHAAGRHAHQVDQHHDQHHGERPRRVRALHAEPGPERGLGDRRAHRRQQHHAQHPHFCLHATHKPRIVGAASAGVKQVSRVASAVHDYV